MHALRNTNLKRTFNEILNCVCILGCCWLCRCAVVLFMMSSNYLRQYDVDNMWPKTKTNKNNVVYCKRSEVKRNKKRRKKEGFWRLSSTNRYPILQIFIYIFYYSFFFFCQKRTSCLHTLIRTRSNSHILYTNVLHLNLWKCCKRQDKLSCSTIG